jgi:hypothetical protein
MLLARGRTRCFGALLGHAEIEPRKADDEAIAPQV